MHQIINVSLQVLPASDKKHPYTIIDEAIRIIQSSGIKYQVCPFETVMEGHYDEIMAVIKKIHAACLDFGADSIISFIKIQIRKNEDVLIEDKMIKYK